LVDNIKISYKKENLRSCRLDLYGPVKWCVDVNAVVTVRIP